MKDLKDSILEGFFTNVGTATSANTVISNQEACDKFIKSLQSMAKSIEKKKGKFSDIVDAMKDAPADKYGIASGPAAKAFRDYMSFCKFCLHKTSIQAWYKNLMKVPAGTVFSIYEDDKLDSQIHIEKNMKIEIKETPESSFEKCYFDDAAEHILIHILAGYTIKYELDI